MKKNILIALFLLLLFSTYKSQNSSSINSKLKVKEIFIENNNILTKEKIKKEFSFLYDQNILILRSKNIEKKIDKNSFIESFEIKRIFPNKLKIKIVEKKPIFILQNKNVKYYYTDKDKVIKYIYLKNFENLPIVFSDRPNFTNFYTNLKIINFPVNTISKFYFFESKRWDLITWTNKTIKLPIKNYQKSLKNFQNLKDKDIFEKYKIFDYRIDDQLILK